MNIRKYVDVVPSSLCDSSSNSSSQTGIFALKSSFRIVRFLTKTDLQFALAASIFFLGLPRRLEGVVIGGMVTGNTATGGI